MSQLITRPANEPTLVAEVVNESYCRNCGSNVTWQDNFCGRCGQGCQDLIENVNPRPPSKASSTSQTDLIASVLTSRLAIASLVAGLGPIGIAAMWFSPSLSKPSKVVWTLCYFGVAIVLPLLIAWYWLDVSVRPLVETLSQ